MPGVGSEFVKLAGGESAGIKHGCGPSTEYMDIQSYIADSNTCIDE